MIDNFTLAKIVVRTIYSIDTFNRAMETSDPYISCIGLKNRIHKQ